MSTPTLTDPSAAGPDRPTGLRGDTERRRGLRRMRLVATSLLVLAAVIYLLTLQHDTGWVGFVNAAAEAAMVGAIADWFAVTALFRHPLGLPVPHTALVPRRKSELGRSLQEFVTEHFLTEQVARARLAEIRVSSRLGDWLASPKHRLRVMREAARAVRAIVRRIPDDQVKAFAGDVLLPRLAREPVAELAGDLLEAVVHDEAHRGLVDLLVGEIHDWLADNEAAFTSIVGERAPWWTPSWLDERVINWAYQQALTWLADIRDDPRHPTRVALDGMLHRLADSLRHDPAVQERAEALKTRLLTHPQVTETVVSLWRAGRRAVREMIDDEDSELYRRADRLLDEVGQRLRTDTGLQERVETIAGDGVGYVVNRYGHEIAGVISHTIDTWDGKDAADRIELHVGRDLQFIRINGTVVGALAGLVIHTVAVLVT